MGGVAGPAASLSEKSPMPLGSPPSGSFPLESSVLRFELPHADTTASTIASAAGAPPREDAIVRRAGNIGATFVTCSVKPLNENPP